MELKIFFLLLCNILTLNHFTWCAGHEKGALSITFVLISFVSSRN